MKSAQEGWADVMSRECFREVEFVVKFITKYDCDDKRVLKYLCVNSFDSFYFEPCFEL